MRNIESVQDDVRMAYGDFKVLKEMIQKWGIDIDKDKLAIITRQFNFIDNFLKDALKEDEDE